MSGQGPDAVGAFVSVPAVSQADGAPYGRRRAPYDWAGGCSIVSSAYGHTQSSRGSQGQRRDVFISPCVREREPTEEEQATTQGRSGKTASAEATCRNHGNRPRFL
ncbi:unnamed protein product [Gadus morhua 'NCC']